MKFCYNCYRITGSTPNGQPVFCSFCGRTYDTKYCSRLHPNPRSAEVCSQCGSKDLTMPQPKVPFLLAPLLFSLTILPGMLLWVLTVAFAIWYLYMLLSHPKLMFQTMLFALLFAMLWLLYLKLPDVMRKGIAKQLFRKSGKGKSGH